MLGCVTDDVSTALLGRLTPEGHANWAALDEASRERLLSWAGAPRSRRGRRARGDELWRLVELGFPRAEAGSPPVIESFIEGVIFGGH
jgi:hypothetical protein